jgi:hypothetical protein
MLVHAKKEYSTEGAMGLLNYKIAFAYSALVLPFDLHGDTM